MQFLARAELTPEREQELLRQPEITRDATGLFLVIREGGQAVEGASDGQPIWLSAGDFAVEAHVPPDLSRDEKHELTEGRWRETDQVDIYKSGIYRLSRSHKVLADLGRPALWIRQDDRTDTKLRHYQEQAGGDVLVLLEDYDEDQWLTQMLIENAQQAWYQGTELLLLGPPAYNKTIAQLAQQGAQCVYDPALFEEATGEATDTGEQVRPKVAKDMVANPCRFQIIQASMSYVKMLGESFDEVGERHQDQWLVPRDEAVELVEQLRERGVELVTRRLDGRKRDYESWSPDMPEDEGPGRPTEREPVTDWELPGPVPGLKPHTVLDAHQVRGAAYILARDYECVVGDEMGLGKTLTSIAAAQYLDGPTLVVCPSNARQVWRQEIEKWSTAEHRILSPGESAVDAERELKNNPKDYVIVSYDGMARFQDVIKNLDWGLAILDEAHYLRNRRTRRVELARELILPIERRVLLTGTPLMNNPGELRSLLYFVHPEEWEDARWFRRRFERPWERGTAEVRESVVERLHEYLDNVMIRRVKADIFHHLPDKDTHVHMVDLSSAWAREYAEEEAQYAQEQRAETDALGSLQQLNRLRQLAVNGKLDEVLPYIRKLLDREEKVVIFGFFLSGLKTLKETFIEYNPAILTGSSNDRQRKQAVDQFQHDDGCRLFIGQVNAAGQAITLTAARHVIFLDLVWNPSVMRQAMDRVHRRGQDKDVHVHFFITEDTVEEDIRDVLEEKAMLVDAVVDDAEFRDIEAVQWEVTKRLLERQGRKR